MSKGLIKIFTIKPDSNEKETDINDFMELVHVKQLRIVQEDDTVLKIIILYNEKE